VTHPSRHALASARSQALDAVRHVLNGAVPHLVVPTSGSTGQSRRVALSGAALRASADATVEWLGGPGRWLLALPVDHVAGLQVLARGLVSGLDPVMLDLSRGFRPEDFAAATADLVERDEATGVRAPRRYTSLVPTQLRRLLDHPMGRLALATYDGVLVGGSASEPRLLENARALGVKVVTTYGMSETAGGCVYDGVPFPDVEVAIDDDGRISLRGPVLADGYLGPDGEIDPVATSECFGTDGWFRTSDAGAWQDGRLVILGRLDDVIVTGGANVVPLVVEAALDAWLGALGGGESCVVGVPDEEWGQRVVAVVRCATSAVRAAVTFSGAVDHFRTHAGADLDREAVPREILVVDDLPLRGPGKIDRQAVAAHARAVLAGRTDGAPTTHHHPAS